MNAVVYRRRPRAGDLQVEEFWADMASMHHSLERLRTMPRQEWGEKSDLDHDRMRTCSDFLRKQARIPEQSIEEDLSLLLKSPHDLSYCEVDLTEVMEVKAPMFKSWCPTSSSGESTECSVHKKLARLAAVLDGFMADGSPIDADCEELVVLQDLLYQLKLHAEVCRECDDGDY